MENKDNDIELLAGQVWNAPPVEPSKYWPFTEREVEQMAAYFGKMSDETLVKCLRPQAEIVRHPIPPHLSENTHEAPHYADILPKKGEC